AVLKRFEARLIYRIIEHAINLRLGLPVLMIQLKGSIQRPVAMISSLIDLIPYMALLRLKSLLASGDVRSPVCSETFFRNELSKGRIAHQGPVPPGHNIAPQQINFVHLPWSFRVVLNSTAQLLQP